MEAVGTERTKIEKLNKITSTDGYWDKVARLMQGVRTQQTLDTWRSLAQVRYNELLQIDNLRNKISMYFLSDTRRKENYADIEICCEKDNDTANEIVKKHIDKMSEDVVKIVATAIANNRVDDYSDGMILINGRWIGHSVR